VAVAIDSQTVRAAETVPLPSRGYDAAKKVNRRKRGVAVDFGGMLQTALVTSASIRDRDIARETVGMTTRLACGRSDHDLGGRRLPWRTGAMCRRTSAVSD
jgi:hypothetical protein